MLTMHIAEDALAGYTMTSNISNGDARIDGIRFGEAGVPGNYLCIYAGDGFVLLSHLKDEIKVFEANMTDVANEILQMTERLRQLERDLHHLIDCGETLQALVDRSVEHFRNPIFIIDETNTVRARSDHALGTVNDDWDCIVQYNRMPIDKVRMIYNSTQGIDWLSPARLKKPFLYGPPGSSVRGINYRIPSADRSVFTGTLIIIENETPITAGMLQYSSILADAIVKWVDKHQGERLMNTVGDTLSDLLNGIKITDEAVQTLVHVINAQDGSYRLSCAISRDAMRMSQYLHLVEEKLTHGVCCEHGELLVMLFDDAQKSENLRMLDQLFKDIPVEIGVSTVFSDLRHCPGCLRQAQIAVRCGNKKISELNAESVMKYIAAEVSATLSGSDLIHPALRRLCRYDARHGTRMYETLRVFLRNERSLSVSLQELNIHRNSLIYRLERIQQIAGCDLEDANTREWLQFSFRMAESQQLLQPNTTGTKGFTS